MSTLDAVKRAAATLTDTLASIAEKVPPLAQVTLSAGGASVTVTPKPPEQPRCPQCGK